MYISKDILKCYSFLCLQLGPTDPEIGERHKKEMSDAKAYAKKMTVVTLGGHKDKDKDKDDKDVKLDMVSVCDQLFYVYDGLCEIITVCFLVFSYLQSSCK